MIRAKYTESQWEADQDRLPGGPGYPDQGPDPLPAAWRDERYIAWHHGDTGRIISEAEALRLLGPRQDRHARKCRCSDCTRTDYYEGCEDWRGQ